LPGACQSCSIFQRTSSLFSWFFVWFLFFCPYFINFGPYFYYFSPFAYFWFGFLVFLGVWEVALGHLSEICLFNICTHGYKFSSWDCLCYVPWVLIGCVFIFISFQGPFDFFSYFFCDPLSNVLLFSFQLFVCFSAVVFVLEC
jgi:hypothetical protein